MFVSYPQCYVVIYYRYSSETRAEIGKHASVHGVTAAANLFSQRLGEKISLTTVRSIRDAYTTELRRKRKASDSDAVVLKLPEKKRGRHVLLGDYLDEKVQLYIKKVRESGGVVTARIAMAAARGILLSYDKHKLQEFGGNICITRDWAYSLLTRMGYVTRKASTAKSKYSVTHFDELKKQFLEDVKVIVQFEEIPSELVLNWDQTGIKMVPTGLYTQWKRKVQNELRLLEPLTNVKSQQFFAALLLAISSRFSLFMEGRQSVAIRNLSFLVTGISRIL